MRSLSAVLNPLLFLLLFGYCPSAVSLATSARIALPSRCDRFKLSEKPSGGEVHNCVGFKVQLIQALFIYRVERRASAEQRAEKQRISVFEALLCALIVTDIEVTTIAFHLNKGL